MGWEEPFNQATCKGQTHSPCPCLPAVTSEETQEEPEQDSEEVLPAQAAPAPGGTDARTRLGASHTSGQSDRRTRSWEALTFIYRPHQRESHRKGSEVSATEFNNDNAAYTKWIPLFPTGTKSAITWHFSADATEPLEQKTRCPVSREALARGVPTVPGTRLSHSTNTSLAWVFRGGTMMVRGFPVQWFSRPPLVSKALALCPVRCCTAA